MNAVDLDRATAGNPAAMATVEAELLRAWTANERDELDVALCDLARRSGDGNAAATELLLRFIQRSGAVRPVVRRYVPPGEVDDVEQQTMIAVQRSVASFRSRSRFTTWLHSVGVHTALAHERARMRRREVAVDTEPDGGDDSGRISSIVVRRADLEQATRALTPEQREALRLWEDGHAYDDIAARLDVPVGTVRSRISRARRHLREATALHDDAPAGDGDGRAER